ncbi:hypothetical protein E2320_018674 [Naja naja]|nr:hypothetical protein E2320_018674 [Naja naja]
MAEEHSSYLEATEDEGLDQHPSYSINPSPHPVFTRGMEHHGHSWESMGKDSGDIVHIIMSCKLHKLYNLRQSCPFCKWSLATFHTCFLTSDMPKDNIFHSCETTYFLTLLLKLLPFFSQFPIP